MDNLGSHADRSRSVNNTRAGLFLLILPAVTTCLLHLLFLARDNLLKVLENSELLFAPFIEGLSGRSSWCAFSEGRLLLKGLHLLEPEPIRAGVCDACSARRPAASSPDVLLRIAGPASTETSPTSSAPTEARLLLRELCLLLNIGV